MDEGGDRPPGPTPFDLLGGEQGIQALVERFYDLMDLEPAYAVLRGVHGADLHNARQRLEKSLFDTADWMRNRPHLAIGTS